MQKLPYVEDTRNGTLIPDSVSHPILEIGI